jgi:His/Glu/Gln/Arg/opine family amino acid ABC transporter permease subunit
VTPTPTFAFEWILVWQHKSEFIYGLELAVKMAALGLVLSAVLGLLLALARMRGGIVGFIAALYINIFRGMPALVTVLWVYFGFSEVFGYNFSVYQAGVISLTLLYSAFISEIYRAALLSIHRGQREAGLALGMRPHWVFVRVVLPQATKIAIPNLGSMLIGMIKDTSTFQAIGATEIIFRINGIENTYYQPFVLYTGAAAMYVSAAFVVDFLFRTLERTLTVPPSRGVAGISGRRRQRQIAAVMERVQGAGAGAR